MVRSVVRTCRIIYFSVPVVELQHQGASVYLNAVAAPSMAVTMCCEANVRNDACFG